MSCQSKLIAELSIIKEVFTKHVIKLKALLAIHFFVLKAFDVLQCKKFYGSEILKSIKFYQRYLSAVGIRVQLEQYH